MNIYKTNIVLQNNTDIFKKLLIKDFNELNIKTHMKKNNVFNFVLDNKYTRLINKFSNVFVQAVNKHYNTDVSINNLSKVRAYVSNQKEYGINIHNHYHIKDKSVTGVYYLTVPNSDGGEIEFYDDYFNKVCKIKPKTNDLIIFDSVLYHRPLPSVSDEYRISLNIVT